MTCTCWAVNIILVFPRYKFKNDVKALSVLLNIWSFIRNLKPSFQELCILTFFFAAVVVVQKLSLWSSVGEIIFIILHNCKHPKKGRDWRLKAKRKTPNRSVSLRRQGSKTVALWPIHISSYSAANHQTDRPLLFWTTWQWSGFIFRIEREGGEKNKSWVSFAVVMHRLPSANVHPGKQIPYIQLMCLLNDK